jgi:hypothetical protein
MHKKNSFTAPYLAYSSELNSTTATKRSAKTLQPNDHLNLISKKYPQAWKMIDGVRKVSHVYEPSWCFTSIATCKEITSIYQEREGTNVTLGDNEKVAALAAWRYTQGIYEFEESIHEALTQSDLKSNLPVDIIKKLPEWCVYIKNPEKGLFKGFFAYLDYDFMSNVTQLYFLLDDGSDLYPLGICLGEWGVNEGISKYFNNLELLYQLDLNKERCDDLIKDALPLAQYCLMLLLYLCTDEPDIDRIENELPVRPSPKRVKRGMRLFPAKKPKYWNVGSQLAKKITLPKEATGNRHKSPTPHIRRGHYHGVWVGKRNSSERKFIYNWWPPTVINAVA